MKKRSMLAIASFAVGVVASVATPTVQPDTVPDAAKDGNGTSAPDLALGSWGPDLEAGGDRDV